MHNEFARVRHPPRPAELGVPYQARRPRAYQFIQGDGRLSIVRGDEFADGPAIIPRPARPNEPQDASAILRLFSRRHASASASTSAAEIRSPELAESRPICTWRRNHASYSAASCCRAT